jgi:uncharacterized Tic20 family protein
MISEEIERLIGLRNSGALSEEEFQRAKSRVLEVGTAQPQSDGRTFFHGTARTDLIFGLEPRIWCTLMHAAQLLTWTGVGIVAPFVMWLISKDTSREANRHGLVILNWMLSSLVYGVISGLACFLVIGIPMLVVLVGLNIVFPIMGALQASGGKLWKYPLTINFFDPESAI